MISNLANFLNNSSKYTGVTAVIIALGAVIAMGLICLLIKNKYVSSFGLALDCLGIVAGVAMMFFTPTIIYRVDKQNLQTELNSKMEIINNEYPYQLSIANNRDVYFVFCKTKDDQNEVIKTMNTGNNPAIRFSNNGATYMNLPQQIHNGIQFEKEVEEKDLLLIVKKNFEEF